MPAFARAIQAYPSQNRSPASSAEKGLSHSFIALSFFCAGSKPGLFISASIVP